MNPGPADPQSLAGRVAELEFLFTHLERQAADLSRVALEQQARISALETEMRVLQRARTSADAPPPEENQ
jgi:hypothetical protein